MDALSLATSRFSAAEDNQRKKFSRFNEFDYIYHSKLRYDDPDLPSKTFNPAVWGFIETIVTRMLASSPKIVYIPREEQDRIAAKIYTNLFSYWYDKTNAFPTIVNWVKDALIYGTGIVKVEWFASPLETGKQYVMNEFGLPAVKLDENGEPLPEFETVEYTYRTFDEPRITNVNIYDFFFDPDASSIEDARWVIYRYYTTFDELEALNKSAEQYGEKRFNKAALKRLREQSAGVKDRGQYERTRRKVNDLLSEVPGEKDKREVEIWEMWEPNRKTIIGNQSEVLSDEENPYWHKQIPFIRIVDSLVPHDFYGKGEIEPVEKLVHVLNTVQNQRITNVNRILSPMWKAKMTVDDEELQFTDNGIIHVDDLQDADVITIPNVTGTAIAEQNTLYDTMQRALGVTDYVQGLQTPGQTAKEVEIKTAQANARFSHKVKLFEQMGLKKLGELVYKLYQQYVTSEKVIRIVGKDGDQWVKINPKDLIGSFDVEPESESTLEQDNQGEYAKFSNLFSVLQPYFKQTDPMTGASVGFVNDREMVLELIRRSGEQEPDRFIETDPLTTPDGQTASEGQIGQMLSGNDLYGGMGALAGQDISGLGFGGPPSGMAGY